MGSCILYDGGKYLQLVVEGVNQYLQLVRVQIEVGLRIESMCFYRSRRGCHSLLTWTVYSTERIFLEKDIFWQVLHTLFSIFRSADLQQETEN